MLSYWQKRLYYVAASPLMRVNAVVYKLFRAPKTGNGQSIKVHLGPGQKNYIDGWVNVDANMFTAKCDVWANIEGQLPFNDASVDAIYSHHVIEHLFDIDKHFSEAFRILKSGGVYRVGVPNGDSAIKKFIEKDSGWFGDFPRSYKSMGGRLNNFILCDNEHLHIMTECYLTELVKAAGFKQISIGFPTRDTGHPCFRDVLGKEHESDVNCPHTLILELTK